MRSESDFNSSTGKGAKAYDTEMLEPIDNTFNQKDMMPVPNSKRQSRQQRASDGKFESGFGGNGRKGNYSSLVADLTEPRPKGPHEGGERKKGRGANKRGGGGDVGNAFYAAS